MVRRPGFFAMTAHLVSPFQQRFSYRGIARQQRCAPLYDNPEGRILCVGTIYNDQRIGVPQRIDRLCVSVRLGFLSAEAHLGEWKVARQRTSSRALYQKVCHFLPACFSVECAITGRPT